MSSTILDLNEARTSPGSRVLSGRDRGVECRKMFNLAQLDSSRESAVLVKIPKDIYSMNTSFFLGLFGDSIRALGREGFLSKYQFDCDELQRETVTGGIERALKETSIFEGMRSAG